MTRRRRARATVLAPVLAAGLLLTACDEGEQGRILRYEQGEYQGQPDRPLDQETLNELQHRARLQQGG